MPEGGLGVSGAARAVVGERLGGPVQTEERADAGDLALASRRGQQARHAAAEPLAQGVEARVRFGRERDRKSTRLNSSHSQISYAVFCLKKKKKKRDERCSR